jgi:hypothetical protein
VTAQGYCSPVTTPGTTTGTGGTTTGAGGGTTTGAVLGTTTSAGGGGGGGGTSQASQPSGAAGAQHTLGSTAPLRAARQSGSLPFTGAQLTIFALVGIALIVGGYLLHTTGRRRSSDA